MAWMKQNLTYLAINQYVLPTINTIITTKPDPTISRFWPINKLLRQIKIEDKKLNKRRMKIIWKQRNHCAIPVASYFQHLLCWCLQQDGIPAKNSPDIQDQMALCPRVSGESATKALNKEVTNITLNEKVETCTLTRIIWTLHSLHN